jgi:hypothetical protein
LDHIGPKCFLVATSVATLKESILAHWPKEKENGPRIVKDVMLISEEKYWRTTKHWGVSELIVSHTWWSYDHACCCSIAFFRERKERSKQTRAEQVHVLHYDLHFEWWSLYYLISHGIRATKRLTSIFPFLQLFFSSHHTCCPSSMATKPTLPQLVTFSNFNLIKLTQENYPTRLPQVIQHLKWGNLFGYVDGSIPCPLPSITTAKEHISITTNLACLHSEMQHQIILDFLTSTISQKIISYVARYTMSNQAWTKLETLFASQSKVRILNVHFQLATLKKANLSIVDYFHKF